MNNVFPHITLAEQSVTVYAEAFFKTGWYMDFSLFLHGFNVNAKLVGLSKWIYHDRINFIIVCSCSDKIVFALAQGYNRWQKPDALFPTI